MYEKELLRWLDGWRELALVSKSFLLWEQPSYPIVLLTTISLLFLEWAYLDPRMLTVLCGVMLVLIVFDYALPRISNRLWSQDEWTADKQRQLEQMSHSLSLSLTFVHQTWTSLMATKSSSPSTFYVIIVPVLFVLGWIGSAVNNLFITYLLVLFMTMFPGLYRRGHIDKYYRLMLESVVQLLRSITSSTKSAPSASPFKKAN